MFKGKGKLGDSLMGAQDLLKVIEHSGKTDFLQMQYFSSGLSKKEVWKQRFVVLIKDLIYVYEEAKSKKPLECIPLLGYDKIQRFNSDANPWSFSIVPTVASMKTRVFSCVSDLNRRQWMDILKKHMSWANDKDIQYSEAVVPRYAEAGTELYQYEDLEKPIAVSRRSATFLNTTVSTSNLELNQATFPIYKDAESARAEDESANQARIVEQGFGLQSMTLYENRSRMSSSNENVESFCLNQNDFASNEDQTFLKLKPPISTVLPTVTDIDPRPVNPVRSSMAMRSDAIETHPIQSPDYEPNIFLEEENASEPSNTGTAQTFRATFSETSTQADHQIRCTTTSVRNNTPEESSRNDLHPNDNSFNTHFKPYNNIPSNPLMDSCLITDPALERDPEECAALLKKTARVGTYLLRKSRQSECLVLAVLTENYEVREYRLSEKDKLYCVPGSNKKLSIEEILHHFTKKAHLTNLNHFLGDGFFVHEAKNGIYTEIQDAML